MQLFAVPMCTGQAAQAAAEGANASAPAASGAAAGRGPGHHHQPTLEFLRLLEEVRFAASPHYMRDAWQRKIGHTTVRPRGRALMVVSSHPLPLTCRR